MAIETIPFDAAPYFPDAETQAKLISDALATGNAGYIATAVGAIARARGMTQVAQHAGVTRQSLYKALSEDGARQLSTLIGVLNALGLKLTAHAA